MVQTANTIPPKISQTSLISVPVTQVLPVHPVEHWHVLGETQDP